MIPLILHFGKVKIIGKENKSVFARDWGKGLITKGSMGIWGGGVTEVFNMLIVVMVTTLQHLLKLTEL